MSKNNQQSLRLMKMVRAIHLLVIKYLEAGGDPAYIAKQLKELSDIVERSE